MPRKPARTDEEAMAKLKERAERSTMAGLGLRFTAVDMAAGMVRAELDPRDDQKNQGDSVHGGILALLADVVAGAGVICTIPEEDWCATTELNISYLGRMRKPPVTIEARALHRGGRTHVWEVDVTDGRGRPMARARVSFLLSRGAPV